MNTLIDYAIRFVGVPYIWGGNSFEGWDCSGLVQELLASVGIDPPGDQTAQGLYDHFSQNCKWNCYGPGSLAFYGKDAKKISHVAMMLDQYRIIEAGGGDSTCTTKEIAAKKGAMVRIRLVKHRNDLVAVLKPNYTGIGLL